MNNLAIGDSALYNNGATFTTAYQGAYNIAIGNKALLANTDGNYNTALGFESLNKNTTGNGNSVHGNGAMNANTTGSYNSALGNLALSSNTNRSINTAIGAGALRFNTSGVYNTALGAGALIYNSVGNLNTAIGNDALNSNTIGIKNVALGVEAGYVNDNSNNCTYIGYQADQNYTTDYYNSTAIGNAARITASSQVRIGNSSVTSIGGYANWTTLSDGRFKKEINADVPGLDFINKLRPVTYHFDINKLNQFIYRDDKVKFTSEELKVKEGELQTGFIAQEVESAARELNYDFSGVDKPKNADDMYGLRYAEFVVPMVKSIQELSKANEELKQHNQELKQDNAELKKEIAAIKKALNLPITTGEVKITQTDEAFYIHPNPATNRVNVTVKNYSDKNLLLRFYDASGKEVLSQAVTSGNIEINTSSLATGKYVASLLEGSKIISAQKLIINK
ncbi:MAG: T9SS type A sorting domain-containing protein [Bacteroidia bacterium]